MQTNLDLLPAAEARVLAAVRLDVTARLIALASPADSALSALAEGRDFVLALSAPGLPSASLRCRAGRIEAFTGGERPGGLPSLTLRFASHKAAASVLSGGRGSPFPLPSGMGAPAALAFFRAAAARAPRMLADPATPASLRASLLSQAALAGLAAVGSLDASLDERMHHVPEGSVAIEAPGCFSWGLEKRGRRILLLPEPPASPNARLSFRDAASAIAVFTGKRPAVLALGSGEVTIAGLLPLVQGLFAVLDRLGDYLAVKAAPKE